MKIFDSIYNSRIMRICRSVGLGGEHEKGVALLFTFMVLVALTSSIAGYLFFVQQSTKYIGIQVNDNQAFNLAEAGLQRAAWYLINGNTAPDSSTDGSWRTSGYPAAPGAGSNDPRQESFANGTYTMWVENSGSSNIQITARGTMNNVERIVRNTFAAATWTEIIYDEFETDFGNWTDGGADCILYTGGTFAHQGNNAVNLQDNTSTSVMSTSDLTLSSYAQLLVEFWYYPRNFNGTEDFWLQISTNGGGLYTTVQSWVNGTDFTNGSFYQESVIINGYTLTDTTRIRFRADASGNGDDVYIDEVRVSATADPAGSLVEIADSWTEI